VETTEAIEINEALKNAGKTYSDIVAYRLITEDGVRRGTSLTEEELDKDEHTNCVYYSETNQLDVNYYSDNIILFSDGTWLARHSLMFNQWWGYNKAPNAKDVLSHGKTFKNKDVFITYEVKEFVDELKDLLKDIKAISIEEEVFMWYSKIGTYSISLSIDLKLWNNEHKVKMLEILKDFCKHKCLKFIKCEDTDNTHYCIADYQFTFNY
jgi:hypothetical protein